MAQGRQVRDVRQKLGYEELYRAGFWPQKQQLEYVLSYMLVGVEERG